MSLAFDCQYGNGLQLIKIGQLFNFKSLYHKPIMLCFCFLLESFRIIHLEFRVRFTFGFDPKK